MKRILLIAAGLSMLVLLSCSRDTDATLTPVAMISKDEMKNKILGTWKLEKSVDEYYEPVGTLVERDEYIGEPGDSVVFTSDGYLLGYEPGYSQDPEIYEYRVNGFGIINIDDEDYKVTKLTDTELDLYLEYVEDGTKEAYSIFLYR